ncbi:MAG: hypothetical protein NC192_08615, partial [Muribaculaceae bacterium]|nr:hypothetical protein [Muribaculaceae bacterium]
VKSYNGQAEKDYAEALEDFQNIYRYVSENKEVYKEFSEYQLSLLDGEQDFVTIERYGDMQETRDIVMEPFGLYAAAYINDNGESVVYYIREVSDKYEISCYYCKDGINRSPYGNDREKLIDGCILLSLSPHINGGVI